MTPNFAKAEAAPPPGTFGTLTFLKFISYTDYKNDELGSMTQIKTSLTKQQLKHGANELHEKTDYQVKKKRKVRFHFNIPSPNTNANQSTNIL